MTENEAIKVFKELLDVPCEMLVKYDSVTTEEQKKALVKIRVAEDMAIQALEEIQECRAIGTVEEIRNKMEELERWHTEKINENIKNPFAYTSTLICHNCDHKDDYIEELEAYVEECRAIGTIEELKSLKEKSVAKKPHSISIANDIGNSMVECPICHARSDYDIKSIKKGHCWRCGQKLDWSE